MKRLIALLLCLMVVLTGCGTGAPAETTAVTTVPEETEPPISPYAQAAMDANELHYYFYTGDGQTVSTGTYQTLSGDATLIFFPNGEIMLIDSSTSIGYPLLKAWLEEKGVWKIDYLVMSHNQGDHAGGIDAGLILDFKIGMLYHNGTKNEALWTALDNDIPFTEMKLGDELQIGSGNSLTTVKCMWPSAEDRVNGSGGAAKNTSLVLRIDFGEHSSLFPGDIYKTWDGAFKDREEKGKYNVEGQIGAEERLAEMYKNGELEVDLLKLANHGNPATSNGKALWDATKPQLAVAMGFYPLDTGYITAYNAWGYEGEVLFDRKHGFIHVTAKNDGTMERETSREDYAEPYGDHWNLDIGG
jgi:beta-lactamase superfamily II metal-dependent hydrolase